MVQLSTIYADVCNAILEPGGLTLGLVTDQEFLDYAYSVIQEILQEGGLIKNIGCIPLQAGATIAVVPDWIQSVEDMYYDQSYLQPATQGGWDLVSPSWRNLISYPQYWAQDRLNPKQTIVIPQASLNGDQVLAGPPYNGFFGTLSGCIPGDITVTSTAPFFGTISSFGGDIYTDTGGPFFGTISTFASAVTNLSIIGPAGVFEAALMMWSPIEGLPDSFTLYVTYGILYRIFSKDGEQKDDQRAAYCKSRFEEGKNLAKMVSRRGMPDAGN